MELCYTNNPKSLFRKYARLVTWFSNTNVGRDYLGLKFNEPIKLFLPNGYHKIIDVKKDKAIVEATFFTRAKFSPLLYPALNKVDLMQPYLSSFEEAKVALMMALKLYKGDDYIKRLLNQPHFAEFTFRSDPDPETTSVDGYLTEGNAVWTTCRNAATATGEVNESGTSLIVGVNNTFQLTWSILLFDTSSLSDTNVIAEASLAVTVTSIDGGDSGYIVTSAPASNTALVGGDYDSRGSVAQSDAPLALTGTGVKSQDFNATGIGNIAKTGVSKFGIRPSDDFDNTEPDNTERADFASADTSGTSSDPLLTVTYADGGGGILFFI